MSIKFFEESCWMVKAARVRRNMSQTDVADIVKTSQSSISRIENCNIKADLLIFLKLLHFFEINIFIEDKGSTQSIKM